MNNSRRTAIVAHGIALYAAHMDQPLNDKPTFTTQLWLEWISQNGPTLTAFVEREQFNLFDRLNAAF